MAAEIRTPGRLRALLALLLGFAVCVPALADDIDLYRNFTPNPNKPPLTVLVLDLNLNPAEVICNNVLLSAACDDLRDVWTLGYLLDMLEVDISALRNLVYFTTGGILGGGIDIYKLLDVSLNDLTVLLTNTLSFFLGPLLQLTALDVLRELLHEIITTIADVRLAIMLAHNDHGAFVDDAWQNCAFADEASIPLERAETVACSNGGYVMIGFLDLLNDPLDETLDYVLDRIDSLAAELLADSSHPFQGKEIYLELAHYLRGDPIYNGHLGYFDYGNSNSSTNLNDFLPAIGWDPTIEDGARYRSALDEFGECDSVNVLNVMLSNSSGDDDSDARLLEVFPGADLDGNGSISFAETVAYAADSGLRHNNNQTTLNSYFLVNGADADATLLQNLLGTVIAVPSLVNLLGLGESAAEFLQPALEVDATMQTPTTTVDANSPVGVLERAYFPMFRPAPDSRPDWFGNVKKLRLVTDGNDSYQYLAAAGSPAIADDGRISEQVRTYWTDPAKLGGYSVDGRDVTLGGAGQRIPGYQYGGGGAPGRNNNSGSRKLFYDKASNNSLAALLPDSSSVVSELQSTLGAASSSEAKELLLYARGYDVGTSSASKGSGNNLVGRDWMMGAVLHSRPVAINYGARSGYTSANPDVRIIFGSTDGWFRMIRDTSSGGAESGQEVWGFMPRSVMSQQKSLRNRQSNGQFPYGVDGAPAVYVRDRSGGGGAGDGVIDNASAGDAVWAFFGLRRSGSDYYALNLTDPDAPSLMWRRSAASSGFGELGLSFSKPAVGQIAYANGGSTSTVPVLIFGGGYDSDKDSEAGSNGQVGSNDDNGNAIYIVDAQTGALIWKAVQGSYNPSAPYDSSNLRFRHPLMVDSIPSEVSALDTTGDGLIDRVYVGDTGGRVWRVDIPGSDRATWSAMPIASLGRHADANVLNDRRFFHRPDFVPSSDASGSFDIVVIASGERPDPLNANTGNRLYAIRDRDISAGKSFSASSGVDRLLTSESDLIQSDDLLDITHFNGTPSVEQLSHGWALSLSAAGEKALSSPLTIGGTIFLTTFVPPGADSSICVPSEGSSKIYGVKLLDGQAGVTDFALDGDGDDRSTTGDSRGFSGDFTPLGISNITANAEIFQPPVRTYWRYSWGERLGDDAEAIPQNP